MDWARLRNASISGATSGFLAGSLTFHWEPSFIVRSAKDCCWNLQIAPFVGSKIPANSSRLASSVDDDWNGYLRRLFPRLEQRFRRSLLLFAAVSSSAVDSAALTMLRATSPLNPNLPSSTALLGR